MKIDILHFIHSQTCSLCHIFEDAKYSIKFFVDNSFYPSLISIDFYMLKVVL